ncbi:MAG TPA: LpxD N-terminal domain-containing protein, partial [Bacteroidia bacterium]|nr:LpxD N-terminal domain-containing protein [Bacteroidia bacterium]
MKIVPAIRLADVASLLNAKYIGDDGFQITGINEIHKVEKGDITFVDHPKYYDKALNSAATTILINKEVSCPEGKALIISDDPFRDYNLLTRKYRPLTFS